MKLTSDIILKLRQSRRMKNRLALEFGKSAQTIDKWIKYNHSNLTKLQALIIISEETGIKQENLVEASETSYA